jgi:two-component sensor histidine kinase
VSVRREDSFGALPAELATPLVMVLTELVGNAVEHGFPEARTGSVVVSGNRDRGFLTVTIVDDGAGLPEKFSIERTDRLGLQIVQTLVNAELGASLELTRRQPDASGQPVSGTAATLRIPLNGGDRQ